MGGAAPKRERINSSQSVALRSGGHRPPCPHGDCACGCFHAAVTKLTGYSRGPGARRGLRCLRWALDHCHPPGRGAENHAMFSTQLTLTTKHAAAGLTCFVCWPPSVNQILGFQQSLGHWRMNLYIKSCVQQGHFFNKIVTCMSVAFSLKSVENLASKCLL